jgi:hypothetical protein
MLREFTRFLHAHEKRGHGTRLKVALNSYPKSPARQAGPTKLYGV